MWEEGGRSRGYVQFCGRSCVCIVSRATSRRGCKMRKNRSLGKVEEDRGRETRSRKGERENERKKLNPRDFIGALPLPRSVSVELFARGGPRLKIVTRTIPGKCVSRESESGGGARVELELMIHRWNKL